jgi:hypothetical protein
MVPWKEKDSDKGYRETENLTHQGGVLHPPSVSYYFDNVILKLLLEQLPRLWCGFLKTQNFYIHFTKPVSYLLFSPRAVSWLKNKSIQIPKHLPPHLRLSGTMAEENVYISRTSKEHWVNTVWGLAILLLLLFSKVLVRIHFCGPSIKVCRTVSMNIVCERRFLSD